MPYSSTGCNGVSVATTEEQCWMPHGMRAEWTFAKDAANHLQSGRPHSFHASSLTSPVIVKRVSIVQFYHLTNFVNVAERSTIT